MKIRAKSSQCKIGISFCSKVFPLFKNGQKKCPKTKTQNTFVQKALPSLFDFSILEKIKKI
jgi:hypothetical protein